MIVGLDLSLTSTGIARVQPGDPAVIETLRVRPGKRTGCARLNVILHEVLDACMDADLVVLEGPAYNQVNAAHTMGGLWWLCRYHLWVLGRQVVVVEPGHLKKYATGRGNAGKDEVLAAIIRRYPATELAGNDEADALCLAAMAADQLGSPLAGVPKLNREALKKWPYAER